MRLFLPRTYMLPKGFRFACFDFIIEFKNKFSDVSGNHGETRFSDQAVYIDEDLKPQMKRETLVHELCHVFLNDIGMFNEDEEEKLVRLISPRITQIFTDNPELTKYVFNLESKNNGRKRKK